MKKSIAILVMVIAAMSICSIVGAYEGKGRGDIASKHKLLSQLPADKELLFHQIMREVRDKTTEIRSQIKRTKKEIHDILTSPEFNEEMFLEKMKSMQILHQKERQTVDEGIAKIAKQFTQEERKILAKIISLKHRKHGRDASH
jgi:uncharacterized membrane protein